MTSAGKRSRIRTAVEEDGAISGWSWTRYRIWRANASSRINESDSRSRTDVRSTGDGPGDARRMVYEARNVNDGEARVITSRFDAMGNESMAECDDGPGVLGAGYFTTNVCKRGVSCATGDGIINRAVTIY